MCIDPYEHERASMTKTVIHTRVFCLSFATLSVISHYIARVFCSSLVTLHTIGYYIDREHGSRIVPVRVAE